MKIAAAAAKGHQTLPSISINKLATLYQFDGWFDCRASGHLIQQCTDHRLLRQGKQIHAHIVLNSIIPDNFLGSKLLTFYSKIGYLSEARHLFDEIPQKNVFSWNAMFIAYTLHNQHSHTVKLFSSLLNYSFNIALLRPDNFSITCVLKALSSSLSLVHSTSSLPKVFHSFVLRNGYECDIFVANALLTFYARSSGLAFARKLFDRINHKDVVTWNSMISAYSQAGSYQECLALYNDMVVLALGGGLKPNSVTMSSVLQACALSNDLNSGIQVHSFIIDNRIHVDAALSNTIIGLYAKCGSLDYARKLFDDMKEEEKDEVTYGCMISGYMIHGFVDKAMQLFGKMKLPALTTWNALLSGLVQNNRHDCIPQLLQQMQWRNGGVFRPNSVTLSCVLPTFSYYSHLKGGKQIHCYAIRRNYDRSIYVATGLIDLYAKAGYLRGAHMVFTECNGRTGNCSVIVWTALISAYAAHGDAKTAVYIFNEMLKCGVKPDTITFTSVLSACAHAGVVDDARRIFHSMLHVYKIHPCVEHYACMVGVLSRAGKLDEATNLILKMPVEPSAKVWGALLNGISVCGDVELGRFVCERLFEIEPDNSWNYIVLANLYSRAGRWEEAQSVREKMNNMGLMKLPGCSWIETSNGLVSFTAGDDSNLVMEEIYVVLQVLVEMTEETELCHIS